MSKEGSAFVELGIKRSSGKGKKYTLEERKAHIVKYQKSGLSLSDYCREQPFVISTLSKWMTDSKLSLSESPLASTLLTKSTLGLKAGIEIILQTGIRLRFAEVSDLSAMIKLIRALNICD